MNKVNKLPQVLRLLKARGHEDLADILKNCRLEIEPTMGLITDNIEPVNAVFYLPLAQYLFMESVPDASKDILLLSLSDVFPVQRGIAVVGYTCVLDDAEDFDESNSDPDLIRNIEEQQVLMMNVATGKVQIDSVRAEYSSRREAIRSALTKRGIEDPVPFDDLWQWYRRWRTGDLPTYQSRRDYLADLFQPLLERIRRGPATPMKLASVEPTGWAIVDRQVDQIRGMLETANAEELFQSVGLLCRETIISLAQAVYDPARHRSTDGKNPSETDAVKMFESYLESELRGSSNEELRVYARAAYKLAVSLQHRRTATSRDALICAEATTTLVNFLAIVTG